MQNLLIFFAGQLDSFCGELELLNHSIFNPTIKNKKWQVTYIAPLQPPTLAVFPPWGSSAGAGRVRPAGAKIGIAAFAAKDG
jgi:hypothetical protein